MKIRQITVFLFFAFASLFSRAFAHDVDTAFVESFLKSYDLSARFNHEYHPALLKDTRESFLELEKAIRSAGFGVSGHMIIMGYQEDAVPSFYTDCSKAYINDEAIVKTARGISSPDRNIFGYLTGFLLKDIAWIQNKCGLEHNVVHDDSGDIDLFDDTSLILQKHAFGDAASAVFQMRDKIEQELPEGDCSGILEHLLTFWQHLYQRSFDNNFYNTIATQDILFSIDYARALLDGASDIKQIFVGPDITYPIEVSDAQQKEVTQHAQHFIGTFMEHMKPVDGKKTAYVFCSFVDGVGKSTLLNNIQNYVEYEDNYELYERCDNSSSQEAALCELGQNTVIVDLPGQVSHFTSKPQGYVYADVASVNMKKLEQIKVIQQAKKNKDEFCKNFTDELWPSDSCEAEFCKNCRLLGLQDEWIPFEHNGKHYLFKKDRPQILRMLVPLEEAHSSGLKTIEPQMMLFSKGLSFPQPLALFYEDLCSKMREAGVQEVVFVDFMSMYPRTSRETIRLNFVMQQLRAVFGQRYPVWNNLYRSFVHPEQEIYHLLKSERRDIVEALVLEAVMRWAIHELLTNKQELNLHLLPTNELHELLRRKCDELLETHYEYLADIVEKKIQDELVFRHNSYALDKVYHTVLQHSFEDVAKFSQLLAGIFSRQIEHEYFNMLWQGLESDLTPHSLENVASDGTILFDDKVPMTIVSKIAGESKNVLDLEPVNNTLRAQWYAALENLLYCERFPDGSYRPKKVEALVPPLLVKEGPNAYYYFLQKSLPKVTDSAAIPVAPLKYHILDMQKTKPWGYFAEKPHCLDWSNPATFFGLFAFGFNPMEKIKSSVTLIYEQFADEQRKKGVTNYVMPTSEIVKRATENQLWGLIDKEVVLMYRGKMDSVRPNDPRLPMMRLWVRMVATLEMIAKDPQAEIVVRKGNREDFASCLKLLERLTLPSYYGLQFDEPLFPDYTAVDPVIPWHELQDVA